MSFPSNSWTMMSRPTHSRLAEACGIAYGYELSVNGRSGRMKNERPAPNNSNPIDP